MFRLEIIQKSFQYSEIYFNEKPLQGAFGQYHTSLCGLKRASLSFTPLRTKQVSEMVQEGKVLEKSSPYRLNKRQHTES